jgi:hypothetical protein
MIGSLYIPSNKNPNFVIVVSRAESTEDDFEFEARVHARSDLWPYINVDSHETNKSCFVVKPLDVLGERFPSGYLFGIRGVNRSSDDATSSFYVPAKEETSPFERSKLD